MHRLFRVLSLAFSAAAPSASGQDVLAVEYALRVRAPDSGDVSIEMRIRGAPAAFRVAMVAHTEYDDKYWQYVSQLTGESRLGTVRVAREDSSVWRVTAPAGDVTLRYHVRYPPAPALQQASWKAHVGPSGGLVGGPHSFLYVVGAEHAPVTVSVDVPPGWRVITGLDTTVNGHSFAAGGVEPLVDSPMLVGVVRSWRFEVEGVPHQVSYLGREGGSAFDSARFVTQVERLARETVRMFGRMPYRRFEFLFEDGAYGGLEHTNSVSIGAQSSDLARDPDSFLGQLAHEFFHTWNEVHLRPASWIGVRHSPPAPTGELWWSEGVTIYYADLLLRRAGLHTRDSTRLTRMERLVATYLANPSHAMMSPESTSRAFNMPATVTGDLTPSFFTQGELLGTLLDLMIRDGSGGRHTLDDAMRALSERFTLEHGFTGDDVQGAVAAACGCDVAQFFDRYIRAAGSPDLEDWLGLAGLRASVTWTPMLRGDGAPAPDVRLSPTGNADQPGVQIRVWSPTTLMGRSGLHTGDRIESLNGQAIADVAQFRDAMGRLRVGDTLRVALRRGTTRHVRTIVITGYDRPSVSIVQRSDATKKQRAILAAWMAGR